MFAHNCLQTGCCTSRDQKMWVLRDNSESLVRLDFDTCLSVAIKRHLLWFFISAVSGKRIERAKGVVASTRAFCEFRIFERTTPQNAETH